MFGRQQLTPEQKAARSAEKARIRAERARAAEARRIREAEERQQRFDAMPEFVVRETREVTVKAAGMQDAITLANIAFKHGQDPDTYVLSEHRKPWNLEGDTVGPIKVTNVKALELKDA